MEIDKELLKGHLESIILSILLSGDTYGYEMIKKIKLTTNSLFEIKEGTLYIVLKRLEQSNFISYYWDERKNVGAKRKYYKITNDGKSYYHKRKSEWEFLKKILDKFYKEI